MASLKVISAMAIATLIVATSLSSPVEAREINCYACFQTSDTDAAKILESGGALGTNNPDCKKSPSKQLKKGPNAGAPAACSTAAGRLKSGGTFFVRSILWGLPESGCEENIVRIYHTYYGDESPSNSFKTKVKDGKVCWCATDLCNNPQQPGTTDNFESGETKIKPRIAVTLILAFVSLTK